MERLIHAEHSSDLGEAIEGDIGDVDVLRAVGAAAQDRNMDTAIALWRLITHSDARSLHTVVAGLRHYAARKGYVLTENSIVRVIYHAVDPVCRTCYGRGHPQIEGTPALSEAPCPACHGSGQNDPHFDEIEKDLADYLGSLSGMAHASISRKLWGAD